MILRIANETKVVSMIIVQLMDDSHPAHLILIQKRGNTFVDVTKLYLSTVAFWIEGSESPNYNQHYELTDDSRLDSKPPGHQAESLRQHSPDTDVSGLQIGQKPGRLKACNRGILFVIKSE